MPGPAGGIIGPAAGRAVAGADDMLPGIVGRAGNAARWGSAGVVDGRDGAAAAGWAVDADALTSATGVAVDRVAGTGAVGVGDACADSAITLGTVVG